MSGYLLDTTVVIDHAEGYPPLSALLEKLFAETGDMYTCAVVTAEALSRGDRDAIAVKRTLLDALEYVAVTPDGARWAGDQRRALIEQGRRKPSTTDALIAALAHALDATVVTRNARDFEAFEVRVLGYGPESTAA